MNDPADDEGQAQAALRQRKPMVAGLDKVRIRQRQRIAPVGLPVDQLTSGAPQQQSTTTAKRAGGRAGNAAIEAVSLKPREAADVFLGRLFRTMQQEAQRAADARPVGHASATSTEHSAYVASVLRKLEAIEACMTPRSAEAAARLSEPETSATSKGMFAAAERTGVPLRRVAALRAIFAGKGAGETGIPEDDFVRKYGKSILGATCDEERRFWCRSLDRNGDGYISFSELAGYLTLATGVKGDYDPNGFFAMGTMEQVPVKRAVGAPRHAADVHSAASTAAETKQSPATTATSLDDARSPHHDVDANNNINSIGHVHVPSMQGYDPETRRRLQALYNDGGISATADLPHHCGQICAFFYVAEIDRLLTAADDGMIIAWEPATFAADPRPVHRGPRPIVGVAYCASQCVFAAVQNDGCVFLYEVHTDRARQHPPRIRFVRCYAPAGLGSLDVDADGRMAYPGCVKSRVHSTRLVPALQIANFPAGCFITCLEFLPRERNAAAESAAAVTITGSADVYAVAGTQLGPVCFVRLAMPSSPNKTEVMHLSELHGSQVTAIALLAGRHLFCSVSLDGAIVVCDFERRAIMHRLLPDGAAADPRPLLGLAVDPVNLYVFVWSARTVSAWDCTTGVRVASLPDHASRVVDMVVDGDERLAFALLVDKSVTVWSTRTWKIVGRVEDYTYRPVQNRLTRFMWWRERRLLVSGGSVPFAWRRRAEHQGAGVGTATAVAATTTAIDDGERDGVATALPELICSRSGGHLVGVGADMVHVWNASDGNELNRWFQPEDEAITAAAMDPDGLRLIVGTEHCRVLFMSYAKGVDSVELRHTEQRRDGIVALAVASGMDNTLRIVVAALQRKLILWKRDCTKFHNVDAPVHVFRLPRDVDGTFTCVAVCHARRRIFVAGTNGGRVLLLSDGLTVLSNFECNSGAVRSLLPCDVESGLFVAFGEAGRASLFGVRRISNDAFLILQSFHATPHARALAAATAAVAAAASPPTSPTTRALGSRRALRDMFATPPRTDTPSVAPASTAAAGAGVAAAVVGGGDTRSSSAGFGDDGVSSTTGGSDRSAAFPRVGGRPTASAAMCTAIALAAGVVAVGDSEGNVSVIQFSLGGAGGGATAHQPHEEARASASLITCFPAHRRGVASMTTTHNAGHVFSLGEDRVLRLWQSCDAAVANSSDHPQVTHHQRPLRQPWTVLCEVSFPSSLPLRPVLSTPSPLLELSQHHPLATTPAELPPLNGEEARLRRLAAEAQLNAQQRSTRRLGNPLGGVAATSSIVAGLAAPLLRMRLGRTHDHLNDVSFGQQQPTASSPLPALAGGSFDLSPNASLTNVVTVASAASLSASPSGFAAGAGLSSPLSSSSAAFDIERAERRVLHRVMRPGVTPAVAATPLLALASTPSGTTNSAQSPLPALRSQTPTVASTAAAASLVLLPSHLRISDCFERYTSHIAGQKPGLVPTRMGNGRIATAVHDIRTMQRAREIAHATRVEPPRAFSRMDVEHVDFLVGATSSPQSMARSRLSLERRRMI